MAELATKEITEPVREVVTSVSPVEQLVQQSTTTYSQPPEITSAGSTTIGKILAANSPTTTSTRPADSGTPLSTTATVQPQTLYTRPLLIGNLMIDPVTGTSTVLTTPSAMGSGGGMGGGASEKSASTGVQKKSWLPVLLIGTGIVIIASKLIGKKAKG